MLCEWSNWVSQRGCSQRLCWPVGHHSVVMNNSIITARLPTSDECVPTRVLGPSIQSEGYIHIVDERKGHE